MTDLPRRVYSRITSSRRARGRAATCREAAYLNPRIEPDAAGEPEGREE